VPSWSARTAPTTTSAARSFARIGQRSGLSLCLSVCRVREAALWQVPSGPRGREDFKVRGGRGAGTEGVSGSERAGAPGPAHRGVPVGTQARERASGGGVRARRTSASDRSPRPRQGWARALRGRRSGEAPRSEALAPEARCIRESASRSRGPRSRRGAEASPRSEGSARRRCRRNTLHTAPPARHLPLPLAATCASGAGA
jgi:hypothetical protein